jgi:hypothetical protein
VKTRVFLEMKKRSSSPSKTTWCDQTIYCSKQNNRKTKSKNNWRSKENA